MVSAGRVELLEPGARVWRASRPSTRHGFHEHAVLLQDYIAFPLRGPADCLRRQRRRGVLSSVADLPIYHQRGTAANGCGPSYKPPRLAARAWLLGCATRLGDGGGNLVSDLAC